MPGHVKMIRRPETLTSRAPSVLAGDSLATSLVRSRIRGSTSPRTMMRRRLLREGLRLVASSSERSSRVADRAGDGDRAPQEARWWTSTPRHRPGHDVSPPAPQLECWFAKHAWICEDRSARSGTRRIIRIVGRTTAVDPRSRAGGRPAIQPRVTRAGGSRLLARRPSAILPRLFHKAGRRISCRPDRTARPMPQMPCVETSSGSEIDGLEFSPPLENSLIPFVDLTRQYRSLRDEMHEALDAVCSRSAFVLGDELE